MTFFESSIDHDESTYLVIADQWLEGHLPFVDFIDVKPIGIYLLFAGALKIFGSSVLAVRLAACLAIVGTALLVRQILVHLKQSLSVANLGGMLYILCISLHKWSWASNTELFFNFFTAASLCLFISKDGRKAFFASGILMGLALIIKYHVLFDFAALGCAYLLSSRSGIFQKLKGMSLACLGLLLPFAIWIGGYFYLGHLEEIKEVIINIPSRYSTSLPFSKRLSFLGEFYLVFLPVSLLFFHSVYLKIKDRENTFVRWLAILWPLFVWLAILLTGKRYFHYYIHQILPLVLIASLGLQPLLDFFRTRRSSRKIASIIFALLFLTPPLLQYQKLHTRQDVGRAAAARINQSIHSEDHIFAATSHIVYFLCDRAPLTRYVHSSILSKPDLIRAFGIDRDLELNRIFSQKPRFCLVQDKDDTLLSSFLVEYQEVERYGGDVVLWERR